MSRCILFSGGPLSDCDQVEVKVGPGDFVIACDAGVGENLSRRALPAEPAERL